MSAEGREWAWALAPVISPTQLLIALALGDRSHPKIAPTQSSLTALMKRTGLSRSAVSDALGALEAAGHLTVDRTPGSRIVNTYHLTSSRGLLVAESYQSDDATSSRELPVLVAEDYQSLVAAAVPIPKNTVLTNDDDTRDELKTRRCRSSSSSSSWTVSGVANRYADEMTAANPRVKDPRQYRAGIITKLRTDPPDADGLTRWQKLGVWHARGGLTLEDVMTGLRADAPVDAPLRSAASVIVERPRHNPECTNCPGDGYVTQYDARGVAFVVECQNGA